MAPFLRRPLKKRKTTTKTSFFMANLLGRWLLIPSQKLSEAPTIKFNALYGNLLLLLCVFFLSRSGSPCAKCMGSLSTDHCLPFNTLAYRMVSAKLANVITNNRDTKRTHSVQSSQRITCGGRKGFNRYCLNIRIQISNYTEHCKLQNWQREISGLSCNGDKPFFYLV